MNDASTLALIGILGTTVGGLFKLLNDNTKATDKLSGAMSHVAISMGEVAKSNKRIATESEKRNGHLAEISVENKDQILKAINGLTIDKQTVHHQVVEHEQVISKE